MSRPVTTLAIFFFALSIFSGTLQTTGVANDLGLTNNVGGSEAANEVSDTARNAQTGAPTGSTLFGLYNVLGGQLSNILSIFNPGMRMLYNAGVPGWLVGNPFTNQVGFLPPIASVIKLIGIISFLRGWGL